MWFCDFLFFDFDSGLGFSCSVLWCSCCLLGIHIFVQRIEKTYIYKYMYICTTERGVKSEREREQ